MKYNIGLLAMIVVGLFGLSLNARVHEISSENKLYSKLRQQQFAIVFFYEENKSLRCDATYRQELRTTRKMFHRLSNQWEYTEGDLLFMNVNILRSDLDEFLQEFGINTFPSFVLFQDGKPLMDTKGNEVRKIVGFSSQHAVRTFIDNAIGEQLSDRRNYKQEVREQRRAEQAYYWSVAPYYYGGCYYDDWYCRPRGYFGFGFSI